MPSRKNKIYTTQDLLGQLTERNTIFRSKNVQQSHRKKPRKLRITAESYCYSEN